MITGLGASSHNKAALGVTALFELALITCGVVMMLKVGALAKLPQGVGLACVITGAVVVLADLVVMIVSRRRYEAYLSTLLPEETVGGHSCLLYNGIYFPIHSQETMTALTEAELEEEQCFLYFENDEHTPESIGIVYCAEGDKLEVHRNCIKTKVFEPILKKVQEDQAEYYFNAFSAIPDHFRKVDL